MAAATAELPRAADIAAALPKAASTATAGLPKPAASAAAVAPKPAAAAAVAPNATASAATGSQEPTAAASSSTARGTQNPITSTPIRVFTAPVKTAPAGGDRKCPVDGSINIVNELQDLSKSVTVIGLGFTKILSGIGLTLDTKKAEEDAEEKGTEDSASKKTREDSASRKGNENNAAKEVGNTNEEANKKSEGAEGAGKKKDAKSKGMMSVVLIAPDWMASVSTELAGVSEVAAGGYESAMVMGRLISAAPVLISVCRKSIKLTKLRFWGVSAAAGRRNEPSSVADASRFKSGTCSHGLHLLFQRPIILRSPNGAIVTCVDGYTMKSIIPDYLSGTKMVSSEAELQEAIGRFRNGTASQFLDIEKNISLETAHALWAVLRNENLTGLVKPGSALAEMALQCAALLEEERVVKGMLSKSEEVVEELRMCCSTIREAGEELLHLV